MKKCVTENTHPFEKNWYYSIPLWRNVCYYSKKIPRIRFTFTKEPLWNNIFQKVLAQTHRSENVWTLLRELAHSFFKCSIWYSTEA